MIYFPFLNALILFSLFFLSSAVFRRVDDDSVTNRSQWHGIECVRPWLSQMWIVFECVSITWKHVN